MITVKKVPVTLELIRKKINELDIKGTLKKNYCDAMGTLNHIVNFKNLNKDLLDYKKVINAIETAHQIKDPTKFYKVNSKKTFFQGIVFVNDHIDCLKIPVEVKDTYRVELKIYINYCRRI